MTREEHDRRNNIRIEREEAFFHGVGLMLIITLIGLAIVVVLNIPWQANAFIAAALVLPLSNLARCIWRQRKQA